MSRPTIHADALRDTGWLDATGFSEPGVLGAAAKSEIKRVGNLVYLQGNGTPGPVLAARTLASPGLFLTLPAGLWAATYAPARGMFSHAYGAQQGILHTFVSRNQVRISFPTPVTGSVAGYLNWSVEFDTTDPWPTL